MDSLAAMLPEPARPPTTLRNLSRPFQEEDPATHDLDVIRSWLAFYDEFIQLSAETPTDNGDLKRVRSCHQYWKRRYAERRAELA